MKKLSLPFLAFLQSTGLIIYLSLIGIFFRNANQWFGKVDNFFSPIVFILLFIVSATISALLVLGRAGFLFWEKKYKEAFSLLVWTLAWSIFYLLVLFAILIFRK